MTDIKTRIKNIRRRLDSHNRYMREVQTKVNHHHHTTVKYIRQIQELERQMYDNAQGQDTIDTVDKYTDSELRDMIRSYHINYTHGINIEPPTMKQHKRYCALRGELIKRNIRGPSDG